MEEIQVLFKNFTRTKEDFQRQIRCCLFCFIFLFCQPSFNFRTFSKMLALVNLLVCISTQYSKCNFCILANEIDLIEFKKDFKNSRTCTFGQFNNFSRLSEPC